MDPRRLPSGTSEIPIERDVLDDLIATGQVEEGMYTERSDGRVNLRVGRELRRNLDSLVVKTKLNYSEVLRRLKLISGAPINPPHRGAD